MNYCSLDLGRSLTGDMFRYPMYLDVPVNDAPGVAGEHRLDHLPEEVPRQILPKAALRLTCLRK